jgi:hypothetical protein
MTDDEPIVPDRPADDPAGDSSPSTKDEAAADARIAPPWYLLLAIAGVGAVLLLGYGYSNKWPALMWVVMLLGLAGMSSGGVVGFLFGLPRSHARDNQEKNASLAGDETRVRYEPSTNLEQISDWLTKILIGVGLVQLQNVGGGLAAIGAMVAGTRTPPIEGAAVVSQIVLVVSVVVGFIAAFLWTRLYYGEIQTRVDQQILDRLAIVGRQAERADTVSHSLAQGKLASSRGGARPVAAPLLPSPVEGAPEAQGAVAVGATSKMPAALAFIADWDESVRAQILEFVHAPVIRDSDPAGKIFDQSPREQNGRTLNARITTAYEDALVVRLEVRALSGAPLEGEVLFLLHPTFDEPSLVKHAKRNVAEVEIFTDGWFTVAAIADKGRTVLTYDLRRMPRAPKWFKDD